MDTKTGWRATPPPVLLAFAMSFVYSLVRAVWTFTQPVERVFDPRLTLVGEGIALATQILVLVGVLELARRAAGARAAFLRVAVLGVALVVAVGLLSNLVQFTKEPWKELWVYRAQEYCAVAGWNLFAYGLVMVLPAQRRMLGWVALAVAFVCWLPPMLREPLWKILGLEGGIGGFKFELALRLARYAALMWLVISASEGHTTPQPPVAADGFRAAGKALWIRVIAALVVVMFTLMMVMGSSRGGGGGALGLFKVLMMGQGLFNVIALTMFGLGALRVVRAGIPELMPTAVTAGATASLWAAGVSLAQLPYLYAMLYREDSNSTVTEYAQGLSLTVPVVVALGVGIIATALSGYAARRGNEDLRSDAQGKGIGFVALMLAAIALQTWMLPQARSLAAFAGLTLLSGIAGLWATILMAKLFTQAADELEREPGLPAASIVETN